MFVDNFMRYLIESLVISLVALYIPRINLNVKEILMISLTGAFTLMIIDLYAPQVGLFLRHSLGGILGFKNIGSSQLVSGGGAYGNFSKGVKSTVKDLKEIESFPDTIRKELEKVGFADKKIKKEPGFFGKAKLKYNEFDEYLMNKVLNGGKINNQNIININNKNVSNYINKLKNSI